MGQMKPQHHDVSTEGWWTHPREPQDMVCIDSEQLMKPHQHEQHHPYMELTEMQQPNLCMHEMEEMRERVRLLKRLVQQQNAQQEQHQGQQTEMGQRTSGDQLLERLVLRTVNIDQQQHPQTPTEQGGLLNFFLPSSQRLKPLLQQTTDDDFDDEDTRSSVIKEEPPNRMQQQHPVKTILPSKRE
jgi:hypothetical protein